MGSQGNALSVSEIPLCAQRLQGTASTLQATRTRGLHAVIGVDENQESKACAANEARQLTRERLECSDECIVPDGNHPGGGEHAGATGSTPAQAEIYERL